MSKAWRGGSDYQWRKLRTFVLNRDQHLCTIKGPRCTGIAECVHHVYGRNVTGDDPRYLQSACNACNLWIGEPFKKTDPPHTSKL